MNIHLTTTLYTPQNNLFFFLFFRFPQRWSPEGEMLSWSELCYKLSVNSCFKHLSWRLRGNQVIIKQLFSLNEHRVNIDPFPTYTVPGYCGSNLRVELFTDETFFSCSEPNISPTVYLCSAEALLLSQLNIIKVKKRQLGNCIWNYNNLTALFYCTFYLQHLKCSR